MAQYTAYMNYVIYFTDLVEYNAAKALCGDIGYGHCPRTAATEFGITWPLLGGLQDKGMYFYPPFVGGLEFLHGGHTGIIIDDTVDSQLVPGQAGVPANIWPKGPDMLAVWWGIIIYQANEVGGVPPTVEIPQRRWISGFETSGYFEEGNQGYVNTQTIGRVASRTGDGMGQPTRGGINGGAQVRLVAQNITGLQPKTSWERFYVRVNNLGTNEYTVWRADSNPFLNSQSIELRFDTNGTILIYNGLVGFMPLIATSALTVTLGKWYLFDILLTWPAAAIDSGRFRLYVNHVSNIDVTNNSGNGIDNLSYHERSLLGRLSTQETLWSVDVDDWICADVPNIGGVESLNSLDWVYGSHVRAQYVKSGTSINWTGNINSLNQSVSPSFPSNSFLTSTTALATIEALTEEIDEYGMPATVIGPVAAWFGVSAIQSGGVANSRIGYSIAGGAYVWKTFSNIAENWYGILYAPIGLTVPTSIVPLSYKYEHPNAADSVTVKAGITAIEYIGAWGVEDDPFLPMDLSNIVRFHNARYHNSIWTLPYTFAGVPDGPVYAVGGTYTGNATSVTVNLFAPAHFVWIRALTGGVLGAKAFGAGMAACKGSTDDNMSNYMTRLWMDNTGQTKFTVAGSNAEINANGVIYQYIAFCDPGTRFNYCSAFNFPDALGSAVISLFDTLFTPEAGFIQKEILDASSSTVYLTYSGPGFAPGAGANMSGVLKNSWGTFAIGALTVNSDSVIADRHQSNYSLWRTTDPYGYVAVQITSYVGDGNASKVINLPIITGRWPLLAIVVPHNSTVAYMRDPSHAGTNSCSVNALANNADAIIAGGPDQITVGTILNTIGVSYDVFVILGDSAGWNNGTFYPPSRLATGIWTLPIYAPPNQPIITMEGGMDFNGNIPILAVVNLSGIYTLVPNKRNDTLYTGIAATTVDVKVPNPMYKTGYIGG
jgi:hypothetical protein